MKVSARLPDDLVNEMDEVVKAGEFPDRSAVLRQALRIFLDYHEDRAIDAAYVAAYTAHPESDEDLRAAERAGRASIAEEPW